MRKGSWKGELNLTKIKLKKRKGWGRKIVGGNRENGRGSREGGKQPNSFIWMLSCASKLRSSKAGRQAGRQAATAIERIKQTGSGIFSNLIWIVRSIEVESPKAWEGNVCGGSTSAAPKPQATHCITFFLHTLHALLPTVTPTFSFLLSVFFFNYIF